MKYGYKETRKIDMSTLRRLCISNHWYNIATEEEYAEFLNYAKCETITTDELVEMATLVKENSQLDYDYEITTIMYEIADKCYSYFEEC